MKKASRSITFKEDEPEKLPVMNSPKSLQQWHVNASFNNIMSAPFGVSYFANDGKPVLGMYLTGGKRDSPKMDLRNPVEYLGYKKAIGTYCSFPTDYNRMDPRSHNFGYQIVINVVTRFYNFPEYKMRFAPPATLSTKTKSRMIPPNPANVMNSITFSKMRFEFKCTEKS
ncbi:hypothetical protein E3N88_25376 [Mikania micrantha]|uniref:Uncharacterized protein n=1 Tax=Mikania micrantha TaxID=192012 RepID=A0A5N6N7D8_9ASTR|nr:hypothetical protein E3N88_25376 [Mikania micrantha]